MTAAILALAVASAGLMMWMVGDTIFSVAFMAGVAIAAALLASPWFPLALTVPGAYALAVLGASLATAPRHALRLALVFPTMHMSWAWGFLTRRH